MQVAMKNMGNKLREDELRELLATADVDGNGTIDYEEFVAATVNLNKLEREEHCMRVRCCPKVCHQTVSTAWQQCPHHSTAVK